MKELFTVVLILGINLNALADSKKDIFGETY
jgi:hypothetical protein